MAMKKILNFFVGLLLRVAPKNLLSYWTGRFVHLRLPQPLGRLSVRLFAWKYRIDMSEAEFPIEEYRSIGELFTRRLKEGVREIAGDCFSVHPCDARLTAHGKVESNTLLQAKGRRYAVGEFVVAQDLVEKVARPNFRWF